MRFCGVPRCCPWWTSVELQLLVQHHLQPQLDASSSHGRFPRCSPWVTVWNGAIGQTEQIQSACEARAQLRVHGPLHTHRGGFKHPPHFHTSLCNVQVSVEQLKKFCYCVWGCAVHCSAEFSFSLLQSSFVKSRLIKEIKACIQKQKTPKINHVSLCLPRRQLRRDNSGLTLPLRRGSDDDLSRDI